MPGVWGGPRGGFFTDRPVPRVWGGPREASSRIGPCPGCGCGADPGLHGPARARGVGQTPGFTGPPPCSGTPGAGGGARDRGSNQAKMPKKDEPIPKNRETAFWYSGPGAYVKDRPAHTHTRRGAGVSAAIYRGGGHSKHRAVRRAPPPRGYHTTVVPDPHGRAPGFTPGPRPHPPGRPRASPGRRGAPPPGFAVEPGDLPDP